MRKMMKKILVAVFAMVMVVSVAFAISADDAQNIVVRNYPGAMIMDVSEDTVDGVTVYQVYFHSQRIAPSDVTIDGNTGEIIGRNVSYR